MSLNVFNEFLTGLASDDESFPALRKTTIKFIQETGKDPGDGFVEGDEDNFKLCGFSKEFEIWLAQGVAPLGYKNYYSRRFKPA